MNELTEQEIEAWWNEVRTSGVWSGSISGLKWKELSPDARDQLRAAISPLDDKIGTARDQISDIIEQL